MVLVLSAAAAGGTVDASNLCSRVVIWFSRKSMSAFILVISCVIIVLTSCT